MKGGGKYSRYIVHFSSSSVVVKYRKVENLLDEVHKSTRIISLLSENSPLDTVIMILQSSGIDVTLPTLNLPT
jgi:hypothetical protein